ncbi:aminoglycoside N(3)-acetyltransferase [Paenisporosarcina sp. TG20]|uniref:aminoglycoside N(3)-acetyltransferase n=1 Tax=Paenisporosarcina sp. TG20 TaxID=1211706 RepID=UPI0002DE1610|nr:AAC(3) family N-acetyltransferase [Paenisporosarcina sp. TG20]
MSEFDRVRETTSFQSVETLKQQLQTLGIQSGDAIMVHSSIKSMGWIAGGPKAVIDALMETITPEGTIVMAAQSAENSEPSYWMLPPVPEDWHEPIRQHMPAYDPHLTPLRGMGKIAECFHRHPKTIRSYHPVHSLMAWGKHAEKWMMEHPLEDSFGMRSPLGAILNENVKILLIGVGYDSCTALHLSENLLEEKTYTDQGAAMLVDGDRTWIEYQSIDVDSDRFPMLGQAFESTHSHALHIGKLGQAECRVIQMNPLIHFGVEWLTNNPVVDED